MTTAGQAPTRQTGTATLRWVVVTVALVLVVVVGGFILVAHFRAHNWLTGLPRRMGVDIQQESNAFTYSQSSRGRKIFTVHASKEVQRTGGTIALHDVGITLFNPAGEPTDHIHGQDFEYNQKNQILTAQGEVFIDLAPPAAKDAAPTAAGDAEPRMVHVKTVGLSFDQKQQVATADGPVAFRSGGYAGNAVGASYDAKDGVVVLQSAVRISGVRNDRPVVLTAARAEMDRQTSVLDLQSARYVSAGSRGSESMAAQHAVVHTDGSGNPQRVDAQGDVVLTSDQHGVVNSERMSVELGAKGQPREAHLAGNVRYASDEGMQREHGRAEDAQIAFDAEGRPVHALFTGGVSLLAQAPAAERDLRSARLEVVLAGVGTQPTMVRSAVADGPDGARLKLVDDDAKGRTSTEIHADQLRGSFAAGDKAAQLTGLDGNGHSRVEKVAFNSVGAETAKDVSLGDTLHMDFQPGAQGRLELKRAEQRGSVRTEHEAVQRTGPPSIEYGRAADAVFDAAANLVHLTGAVEVQDESSALFADRVDVNRATGDATANGAVRVTYVQASDPAADASTAPAAGSGPNAATASARTVAREPVHVLAARAVAHKATGLAEFFGDAHAPARLWQGASQVEAPVLDFYRNEKRLLAHSDPGSSAATVRTLLVQQPQQGPQAGAPGKGNGKPGEGPVRVVSRELVYTDSTRTAEFEGAVRMVDQNGLIAADTATVYLSSAASSAAASAPSPAHGDQAGRPVPALMGGRVDRIVATGSVVLDQPGRRGTGERLVYTTGDGLFVLTGTKAVPPRVDDQAQGSVTGTALRFHSGDDSVEILGGDAGKTSGRLRSETRVRQ
jgi:lipopolysaccharide export system protein LptA